MPCGRRDGSRQVGPDSRKADTDRIVEFPTCCPFLVHAAPIVACWIGFFGYMKIWFVARG